MLTAGEDKGERDRFIPAKTKVREGRFVGGFGHRAKIEFRRIIVHPGGREEIEGVTPKQLPAPSPVSVENNDQLICVEKPSQNSASDDQ